jgi:Holliday junction DNA helicase RuvA
MYAYVKGILIEATPNYAVIETNQIGFYLEIGPSTLSRLPQMGTQTQLFTSLIVRENSQTLYGFLSPGEKQLFEGLLTVSGIGPKLALSLCNHLPPEDLLSALIRKDIPLLTKVPGIGKKTAERLILDLRDKAPTLLSHTPHAYQTPLPLDQKTTDALSALIHLGYTQGAAQKALSKCSDGLSLSDLITAALKHI